MVKEIAVYGTYETKEKVRQRYWKRKVVRQRYWKRRVDGVKQRYWRKTEVKQRYRKKTSRLMKAVKKGRYEFHGKGKDLFKAVIKAHTILPKGYIHVPAQTFLEKPEKYGVEGEWIEREIESP